MLSHEWRDERRSKVFKAYTMRCDAASFGRKDKGNYQSFAKGFIPTSHVCQSRIGGVSLRLGCKSRHGKCPPSALVRTRLLELQSGLMQMPVRHVWFCMAFMDYPCLREFVSQEGEKGTDEGYPVGRKMSGACGRSRTSRSRWKTHKYLK